MKNVHRSNSIHEYLCVHTVWKPVNDWFDQKQWLNVSTRGFQPKPSQHQQPTTATTTATALAISTQQQKQNQTERNQQKRIATVVSILYTHTHTHEKIPHTTDFDDGETWVQALHIGDWCVSVFVRKRKRQAPHKESMCYDVNTSMCIKTQTHGLENNIVHRPQRWSANDKRIFTWKMLVNSKNSYRISYRIDRYSILINTYRWFQIRFLENTNRCKNSIILLF